MEAGALSALNDEDLAIQEAFPMIPHDTEAAYEATAAHLVYTWEILSSDGSRADNRLYHTAEQS